LHQESKHLIYKKILSQFYVKPLKEIDCNNLEMEPIIQELQNPGNKHNIQKNIRNTKKFISKYSKI